MRFVFVNQSLRKKGLENVSNKGNRFYGTFYVKDDTKKREIECENANDKSRKYKKLFTELSRLL